MADSPDRDPLEGWPSPKACFEEAWKQTRALLPHNPFLALEAAERTLALVEDKILQGWKPRKPLSWVRGVARKEALHLASRKKKKPLSLDSLAPEKDGPLLGPSDLRLSTPPEWKETLLQHEKDILEKCTARQRKTYWGYCLEESVKKAAKRAGMTERDLRVALKEIAKIFRKSLPPPHYLGREEKKDGRHKKKEANTKRRKFLIYEGLTGVLCFLFLFLTCWGSSVYANPPMEGNQLPTGTAWICEPYGGGSFTIVIKETSNGHQYFEHNGKRYYWDAGSKSYKAYDGSRFVFHLSTHTYDYYPPPGAGGEAEEGEFYEIPPPIGG